MKRLLLIFIICFSSILVRAVNDTTDTEKRHTLLIQYTPVIAYVNMRAHSTQPEPIRTFILKSFLRTGIIHNPSNIGIGATGHHWMFKSNVGGMPEDVYGLGVFIRYYPPFLSTGMFDKIGILKFLDEINFQTFFQMEYLGINYTRDEYGFPEKLPGLPAAKILPALGIDFQLKWFRFDIWAALDMIRHDSELFYHRSTGSIGLLFKL